MRILKSLCLLLFSLFLNIGLTHCTKVSPSGEKSLPDPLGEATSDAIKETKVDPKDPGKTCPEGDSSCSVANIPVPVEEGAVPATVENYDETQRAKPLESCMECHNQSEKNDYAGNGLMNPHPFSNRANILCSTCHGGDPALRDKDEYSKKERMNLAHVPPPPDIGNWRKLDANDVVDDPDDARAEFNRRTLAGIDKMGVYQKDGKEYTGLQYLQFINPGDYRVVSKEESCGLAGCHAGQHASWLKGSPILNEVGFFSGMSYGIGLKNDFCDSLPIIDLLYEKTCAQYGFRDAIDALFAERDLAVGNVPQLKEFPFYDSYEDRKKFENNAYDFDNIVNNSINDTKNVSYDSPLNHVLFAAVDQACGDCHASTAGANNRFGDFRSSGCTSCHMQYSMSGKSYSKDPNINDPDLDLDEKEPENPDAIAPGEKAHIVNHRINSVAKFHEESGVKGKGIEDTACIGCHQGSNRTVLQYWGIRLDQNRDVAQNNQYPLNPGANDPIEESDPNNFLTTEDDKRLFDPEINNNTFNGRTHDQYLAEEDYDNDGRDDTPPDIHHEKGMGCIDCHGSRDLHNGQTGDPSSGALISRRSQAVKISCESCHGGIEGYAETKPCQTYDGLSADCAVDQAGNALKHVTKAGDGGFWLKSKVTGKKHFLPQTHDVVVDTKRVNPLTNEPIYSQKASFAMGRADGNPATGIGPKQSDRPANGFSHSDNLTCSTCHSSWVNNCVGCHIRNQYNDNNDAFVFSNITGERAATVVTNADFTYQSPIFNYLAINAEGKIAATSPGMKMFYRYGDSDGNDTDVLTFSDRNGNGSNPEVGGRAKHPGLSIDIQAAHSIRGKVTASDEGPRYCVNCHLTTEGLAQYGEQYSAFRQAFKTENYDDFDFNLLIDHFGSNTGNHLNSPMWVHMVAGLGSGLYLFDENGCPINPFDDNANRAFCPDGPPNQSFVDNNFSTNLIKYNLDKMVNTTGVENVSSMHPINGDVGYDPALRDGSLNPNLSGPLGRSLLEKLTDPEKGVVLDSWLDPNGQYKGNAQQKAQ